MSKRTTTQAVELLLCAAWLAIQGEEDPVIAAANELDIPFGKKVWNLAYDTRAQCQHRRHNLRHFVTCLEAAYQLADEAIARGELP